MKIIQNTPAQNDCYNHPLRCVDEYNQMHSDPVSYKMSSVEALSGISGSASGSTGLLRRFLRLRGPSPFLFLSLLGRLLGARVVVHNQTTGALISLNPSQNFIPSFVPKDPSFRVNLPYIRKIYRGKVMCRQRSMLPA